MVSYILLLGVIAFIYVFDTCEAIQHRESPTQQLLDNLRNIPTSAKENTNVNDVLDRWAHSDTIGEFRAGITYSSEPDKYKERLLLIPDKDELPFGEEEEIDELLGTTITDRSSSETFESILKHAEQDLTSNSTSSSSSNSSNRNDTSASSSSSHNKKADIKAEANKNNTTSTSTDDDASKRGDDTSKKSDDWAEKIRRKERERLKAKSTKDKKEKKVDKEAEKLENEVKKKAEKKINKEHKNDEKQSEKQSEKKEDKHEWDYKENGKDWKGLCVDGKKQSPINILTSDVKKSDSATDLKVEYKPVQSATIVNNGHTLQVTNEFGSVSFQGSTYKVLQFHFHTPSEHQIDGRSTDLEMHIVHQKVGSSGTADLLVMGILFDANQTTSHAFLQQLQPHSFPTMTKESSSAASTLDLAQLMNWNVPNSFYTYQGSLTTPKCDETVTWIVYQTTQAMSKEELLSFSKAMKHHGVSNNRLIQPLHSRPITLFA